MQKIRYYGLPPFRLAVLHGGPGAPGTVAAVARALSKDLGVLEPLQTASTLEGQLQELHDTLQAQVQLPLVLLGHSWGAWLGYLFAARYPAYVIRLILVSAGPFASEYVPQLEATRLSRLEKEEGETFRKLLAGLHRPHKGGKPELWAEFGRLITKTDYFSPIAIPADEADVLPEMVGACRPAWETAAGLRQSGALLAIGRQIQCPVVAVHGDYDPHPAAGVREPLETVLRDFTFILLKKCGHTPWKERYAREQFYAILRGLLR